MILPIFLTSQYVSVNLDDSTHPGKKGIAQHNLINLRPALDPLVPIISTSRIRELLKNIVSDEQLQDFRPVVLSIADQNFDIELGYDFQNILDSVSFAIIVPEYYYPKALDMIAPSSANIFLNCRKYGLPIPEEVKIEIDVATISLYTKDNVGKFISQNQIIISTADVDAKFKPEYTEAMVKSLSDNIQIAGVWKIIIDTQYRLFPTLIGALEDHSSIEQFFEAFDDDADGKLIIAPGVTELQLGENDSFETIPLVNTQLNKFKIKDDDKITFKWKSDKSKFEGEIYGSKTGIRIDVRDRTK